MNCAENNAGVVPCRCHCKGCGLLDTVGMSIGMCWLYFGWIWLWCSRILFSVCSGWFFPSTFSNVSTQASSASNAAAPPRQKNRGERPWQWWICGWQGILSMQTLENVALIWNVVFFQNPREPLLQQAEFSRKPKKRLLLNIFHLQSQDVPRLNIHNKFVLFVAFIGGTVVVSLDRYFQKKDMRFHCTFFKEAFHRSLSHRWCNEPQAWSSALFG